jgi:hypothetical protein
MAKRFTREERLNVLRNLLEYAVAEVRGMSLPQIRQALEAAVAAIEAANADEFTQQPRRLPRCGKGNVIRLVVDRDRQERSGTKT